MPRQCLKERKMLGEAIFGRGQKVDGTYKGEFVMIVKRYKNNQVQIATKKGFMTIPKRELKKIKC